MAVRFYSYVFWMACWAKGSGDIPICSTKPEVTASIGGATLLPCQFTYGKSINGLTVVWRRTTEGGEDIVHNQGKSGTFKNQSAAYVDRTAMSKDWFQSKNATLSLERIRAEDAGEYSCWIIQSPPSLLTSYKCCTIRLHVDPQWKGDIKVTVVFCSIYLLVLTLCVYILWRCRQQQK